MKNKVLKIALVIMLILAMTTADFLLVGMNLVSYAIGNSDDSTSNQNVKFIAYFKTEEKEVSKIENQIDNDEMKLYVKVAVKNDGYFDGVITLNKSANFKLKEQILNDNISSIEGNTITLNRITAGNTVELEVGIEPVIKESYEVNMLSKESTLNLTGKYYDSTQKSIEIEAQKNVTLTLLTPGNLETTFESEVITNRIYTIGEEETRLVQIELNSSVIENAYPIRKTIFKTELPEGAEVVEVISKGTYATNGKGEQVLKQYTNYKVENNLLTVEVQNYGETISWKKDTTDKVVVTLKLDKNSETGIEEYSINSKVEFYGSEEKSIEKQAKYNLTEESDGVIRTFIEKNQEEIYKGKLYSGENREYQTTTNIEINYANLIQSATVEEKSTYRTEESSDDLLANIQYKTSTISKAEIDKVLGKDGILTIRSGTQEIIITSNEEADENGNIIIEHEDGVKELQIMTTKAASAGIIRLNHVKVIKADSYTRDQITNDINYLVNKATIKYDNVEYNFETTTKLKETSTAAELTVAPQTLTTATVNEQVKMAVTLRTDNEQYDLYKNPTITIKLPDYVTNVKVIKTTPLYLGNMVITTYQYLADTKEIEVKLLGEQTTYSGINTNMYIEILANIELEETTSNREDVITLKYTNENATTYQSDGKVEVPVNISGLSGLVAFNRITSHNLKTNSVTSNESQIGTLKMYQDATEADFEITLINNSAEDLKDIRVLGNLPVQGEITLEKYTFENTIDATLKSGINIETGEAKVYYTSNKKATKDLENNENGWSETPSEDAILYMIVIPNMAIGAKFVANYTMNIPANLQVDQDMKTTFIADYSTEATNSSTNAIPVGFETGKVAVNLEAAVGKNLLKTGDTVKAGEVIKYKVTVNNTGSTDVENAKVTGVIPEGTVYVRPIDNYAHTGRIYYEELENTVFEQIIEKLSAGEIKTIEYEVRVKGNTTAETVTNQISVLYNEDIEVKSNSLNYKLEPATIRVTLKRAAKTDYLVPSNIGQYFVIVENISDVEQTNIDVTFDIPNEVMNLEAIKEIDGEILETSNKWNIESIAAGSYKIYQLFLKVNPIEESIHVLQLNCSATQNGNAYRSNVYTDTVYGIDVEIKMTSPSEGEYVKTENNIEYEIEIVNKSQIPVTMMLVDNIPEQLTVQGIEIDGQKTEEISGNLIYRALEIEANSIKIVKISTIVNYDINRIDNQTIKNIAKIFSGEEEITSSEEVRHIVEAIEIQEDITTDVPSDVPSDGPNNDKTPGRTEGSGNTETKNKYDISGKAWIDQDKDGEMNNTDEVLKSIKVKLLNIETNEFIKNAEKNKDLIVETNQEGYYTFENIEEGKYIVVFEYDAMLYKPTTYEKEGISESRNSNVVSKNLTVNGEAKEYAATNEIELKQNIANINMGLVFVKQFDIQVDKYVSKVIVQDSKETKTYEYNNKNFAKVEINAKRIVGSTILVQYTMKLTNTGDVDAYVNSLVDYIPSGLKFSSELNKDWYEVGTGLYTNSLGTTAIAPGESKEIKLVLTKTKTDGSAELINNMAEISDAYNIYGIQDINSTQENKNKDENDLGSADLIISIQTGTVFNYISLVISMLLMIGAAVYLINKKITRIRF